MELFVQRMRRPEKKEEVKKSSFEYTSRATPQGVAGMTEMTRVVGLSHGAAKEQRARTLTLQLHRRDEPSIPLTLHVGWLCKDGEAGPGVTRHYLIVSR